MRIATTSMIATSVGTGAAAAGTEMVTLVVSRSATSIEFYAKLPASRVSGLFGTSSDLWARSDGTVDLTQFQVDTANLGDAIFAEAKVHVADDMQQAEAISVMMHEASVAVPFETPWDAITGVTLCSVPIVNPTPALSNVRAYLGFSLYPVDGYAPLSITFPRTGRGDVPVEVLEFHDNESAGPQRMTLADGAPLRLAGIGSGDSVLNVGLGATGVAVGLGAAGYAAKRRLAD